MIDFGESVRWRRKALGLTQAELGAKIRRRRRPVGQDVISRIENGRVDPPLSLVRSLARALHIRPWQLLVGFSESAEFWRGYLDLAPVQKREIQRNIRWMIERRMV